MTKTVTNSFGTILLQLRRKRGLSMQALASQIGISSAYICRLEAGERRPSRDLLDNLIHALIPESQQSERDEILISAGFAPANLKNFMGRQDSLSLFQQALSKNPKNFKVFLSYVRCLIRTGQEQDALQQIQFGMQNFDDMIELQTLLALLELSKKNFPQAVQFQSSAIQAFQSNYQNNTDLSLSDLLLSLGVMYFEQANQLAQQSSQAISQKQVEQSQVYTHAALSELKQAQSTFEQALKHSPDDIYILDELARVYFTIAYLLPLKQAKAYWDVCIDAFQKSIYAENKHELGYKALLQSTAFLALAFAKAERFQDAWFTLNMLEACLPHYWLVHYVKACYFGLKIQSEFEGVYTTDSKHYFDLAIKALNEALTTIDTENRTASEALIDPDLEPIRHYCAKAFNKMMQGTAKAKS